MRIKFIMPLLAMAVAAIGCSIDSARAANVDVLINGYLPAPPGVSVHVDAGRPYYVEHDRRVYMEKEKPGRHKQKKEKKRHEDKGDKHGHDQNDRHEEHEVHGR